MVHSRYAILLFTIFSCTNCTYYTVYLLFQLFSLTILHCALFTDHRVFIMCEVYTWTDLTDREKWCLTYRIRKFICTPTGTNDCTFWKQSGKPTNDGYGYLHTRLRGKNYKFSAHRLAYFVGSGFPPLDQHIHVSHLCHHKLCVKFEHLSYETAHINQSRKRCLRSKTCHGHGDSAQCIL